MSAKAMHAAARRYLWGRLALFNQARDVYRKALAAQHTADESTAPGNWGIARHMLRHIEGRVPSDFETAEELRAWLLRLAEPHESDLLWPVGTMHKGDSIQMHYKARDAEALAGARSERELFGAFLRGLTDADLARVAPLPYRHVLGERASARWRAKLAERWDAHPREAYWYPLRDDPPPDVLALQDLYFYLEVEPAAFRALFHQRGVGRVFEFVENHVFEPDVELDVELLVPRPSERFWTSRDLSWVVYVSHEHSITFAGAWLVEGVKSIWPRWSERLYTGYEYAAEVSRSSPSLYETAYRAGPWREGEWRDFTL